MVGSFPERTKIYVQNPTELLVGYSRVPMLKASHGAQQAFARSCDLQSPSTFEIGHLARILDPLWPVLYHRMFHDVPWFGTSSRLHMKLDSDNLGHFICRSIYFKKKSIIVVSKVRARETLVLLYTTVVLFQHIWHMLSYVTFFLSWWSDLECIQCEHVESGAKQARPRMPALDLHP